MICCLVVLWGLTGTAAYQMALTIDKRDRLLNEVSPWSVWLMLLGPILLLLLLWCLYSERVESDRHEHEES